MCLRSSDSGGAVNNQKGHGPLPRYKIEHFNKSIAVDTKRSRLYNVDALWSKALGVWSLEDQESNLSGIRTITKINSLVPCPIINFSLKISFKGFTTVQTISTDMG